mmetsp:Transcript_22137/g.61520  ORF Transcript_22137/g.61520 Transcript_22137/m.61520 type:complete len:283 (+) Transcript_22137:78-926(+)|eukprot:CAMPEP_0168749490 /NCGR_PEP_ID=MMETSP0724-20121128/16744_1 /TAXON_ID=265536 /ORGANISM="Amphiprora sp., Strain CCMP467" /LENGTH=282 /DNA_ID=CAMNT_0008797403 /DNA_START=33 /DNA_END=881 /DNA_ORIENTATION=+
MRSLAFVILASVVVISQHRVTAFAPSLTSHHHSQAIKSTSTDEETTTATVNPRDVGLALQLDDGTRKSHSVAENTAFVSGFFKGLSTRQSYRDLITSLYFVYEAMERSFDTTTDESVKALDAPELRRLDSLKKDMEYFYGTEQVPSLAMSPATKAYVARIEEIASGDKPYLLIGHQYSRYLGDLFGGQMMGSMARRSLDLSEGHGVQFYEFKDINNTKDYITEWYHILNRLELTDVEKQAIVDEANYCFALNIAIFEELDGSALKAMFTLGINTLKMKLGLK